MHGLLHDCGLLRFGGWIDSRCAGGDGSAAARCRKDENRTTEQTMNRLVRHGDLLPDPLSRSRARLNSGAPSSTSPREVLRAGGLPGLGARPGARATTADDSPSYRLVLAINAAMKRST